MSKHNEWLNKCNGLQGRSVLKQDAINSKSTASILPSSHLSESCSWKLYMLLSGSFTQSMPIYLSLYVPGEWSHWKAKQLKRKVHCRTFLFQWQLTLFWQIQIMYLICARYFVCKLWPMDIQRAGEFKFFLFILKFRSNRHKSII